MPPLDEVAFRKLSASEMVDAILVLHDMDWVHPTDQRLPVSKRFLRRYMRQMTRPKMAQDRRQPQRMAPGKTIFGHRTVRAQKRVAEMDWEIFGVQPSGEERSLCKVGWRYAFDPRPLMHSGNGPDFLAALEASLCQAPLTAEEVATMHAKVPGLPRPLPLPVRDPNKWPMPGTTSTSTVLGVAPVPTEKATTPKRRLKKGRLSRKRKVVFDD